MEYYFAIKQTWLLRVVATWIDLKGIVLSEKI